MKNILYIGNKLAKHGLTPTSVDTLPILLEKEGFKIKSISSFKSKPLRLIHMLLGILVNISKRDLVVIDTYSTTNFWYAVICARLCKLFSIPFFFILHGGNLERRLDNSSSGILNLFKEAKANVVPSNFLLERLEKFYLGHLVHIPNSLELKQYKFTERGEVTPKLLWVRSFAEIYNPVLALKVVEILLKDFPEVQLCMVGPDRDGSLQPVKKIIERKNLPVTIKGKLSKQEWTVLSRDYDIFLNTTNIDNTPVSILEAMALGMPVVSTNVGGIPYMIDNGCNGLLVPPEAPEVMANAVKGLLADPGLAGKLSVNGRKKVEDFDWEKVKRQWLDLLG